MDAVAPLRDPSRGDFRLHPGSAAVDYGAASNPKRRGKTRERWSAFDGDWRPPQAVPRYVCSSSMDCSSKSRPSAMTMSPLPQRGQYISNSSIGSRTPQARQTL